MTGSPAPEVPRRAVFLDRDGVLNRAVMRGGRPFSPASAEETELLEGVEAACRALKAAGFLLICVTNQPDIARRTRTRAEVEAINEKLKSALGLDDVRMCPHDDGDGCACRKPKPGLLLDAARANPVHIGSPKMPYSICFNRKFVIANESICSGFALRILIWT